MDKASPEHIVRLVGRMRAGLGQRVPRSQAEIDRLDAQNMEFIRRLKQFEPDVIERAFDAYTGRGMPDVQTMVGMCRDFSGERPGGQKGSPPGPFITRLLQLGYDPRDLAAVSGEQILRLMHAQPELGNDQFRLAMDTIMQGQEWHPPSYRGTTALQPVITDPDGMIAKFQEIRDNPHNYGMVLNGQFTPNGPDLIGLGAAMMRMAGLEPGEEWDAYRQHTRLGRPAE